MRERFNPMLRTALLASRWLMAPLCLGLIAALLMLVAQFCRELAHAVLGFAAMGGSEVILVILKLIDLVLIANLLLMIVSAGVEIFLPEGERPHSIGIAEFAALKPRLFASISAIAAIDLLESFVNIDGANKTGLAWEVAILLAFVVAGVLLAWMDRLEGERR